MEKRRGRKRVEVKKVLKTISLDKELIDFLENNAKGQGMLFSSYVNWYLREVNGLNK